MRNGLDKIRTDLPEKADQIGRIADRFKTAFAACEPGIQAASAAMTPEQNVKAGQKLNDECRDVLNSAVSVLLAAVNVFQLADIDALVERLGDRGYRWAQLEAGIRAGRVQIGAFARGWGAAASTFFDDEVSRELGTTDSPMLMVAVGPR